MSESVKAPTTTPSIEEIRRRTSAHFDNEFDNEEAEIAFLRSGIDFLLDEVDRLKAENERLEQRLQPIRIAGVEIPDPHPGYDCCGTCPLHLGLPYTAQD